MSLRRFLCLILVALAALPEPAFGFDRVVHYDLVYAVAIANGYNASEAALIARASQSLDDNLSTTAFDWSLVGKEMKDVGAGQGSLRDLPHMKSGQVFHALTTNRDVIERAHIERIERALTDSSISEQRRLLYLGEYLHFVADEVVHPTDPLLGHFKEGHYPDRSDFNPDKLQIVTALLNDKISAYHDHRALMPTTPDQLTHIPEKLSTDTRANGLLHKVVQTIADSWTRSYPNETTCYGTAGCWNLTQAGKSAAWSLAEEKTGMSKDTMLDVGDVYLDFHEKDREARAASEIARDLLQAGYNYTVYRPDKAIQLDSNGEPRTDGLGSQQFGARPASAPAFAATLAAAPPLNQERQDVALVQVFRAGNMATEAVARDFGIALPQQVIDEQRKAAAWFPPSSPGGIALNPSLEMPLAALGHPTRLEDEGLALFLVTDKGRFRFVGVSARSFATLARAIAAGEIPYLSIGSEPSDRPGFARVTYAPALRGTVEGLALYEADVQFKTIFARLPLTDEARVRGLDTLLAGYPGAGGDFVRFWITSKNIRLAVNGDRLTTADPGMRINCETRLHFAVRSDPEMDAYVAGLTNHWDDIAKRLPEFREVQTLALTTAIVFWARDHRVPIDPALFLEPPQTALTPDYAPLVGVLDKTLSVAGGVSLAPEDRDTELGRIFLTGIAYQLSQSDATDGPWLARTLLAAEGLLILALALALPSLVLRWLAGRTPEAVSFPMAFMAWSASCIAQIAIIALMHPLILGSTLSFFDRDLLALLATIGLFPILLFWILRRPMNRPPMNSWRRRATLVLGLFGPLAAGLAGVGLAEITIAVTGPVPSPSLHRILTLEVSPLEAVGRALVTKSVKPGGASTFFPVPQSLLETFRPDFELRSFAGDAKDVIEVQDDNPNFPARTLKRIHWPQDQMPRPGLTYYSIDGRPPF